MSKNLTKAQRRAVFAEAGIMSDVGAMSPERLQARLAQRPVRLPNKRAQAAKRACRGMAR